MKVLSFQNERLPQCPGTMYAKRSKLRTLVIEKGRILKASRRKTYHVQRIKKKNGIGLLNSSTGSWEAMEQSVLKILTDHNFQPRSLYSVELSVKGEGAIETSSDKGELKILCPRPPF